MKSERDGFIKAKVRKLVAGVLLCQLRTDSCCVLAFPAASLAFHSTKKTQKIYILLVLFFVLSCRALCLRVDFLLAGFRRQPFRRQSSRGSNMCNSYR
jgi:hypothetical protein